jgi:16S rRNA (adenine1518-N6/adenine1519-N6)-dimethyltransferase
MKESRLMKYKKRVSENIKSGDFSLNEKFKTKKSLGQNFLNNKGILELIAKSAEVGTGELILEIGPGEGALTGYLLKEVTEKESSSLLCIEKDHRLIDTLNEKFEEGITKNKIEIIEEDILRWNSLEYFTKNKINNFEYKLIANIPYYITGAIIERFLEEKTKPSVMILMVQKEVAQRMASKDEKGSILSLCTKYYADVEILKIVSKGSFSPAPKIDSAVIKIKLKQEKLLDKKYLSLENKYLNIVKVGLSHKRKTLISNLKKSNNKEISGINWEKVFEELNLDKKIRGEDLTVDDFLKIVYNTDMV